MKQTNETNNRTEQETDILDSTIKAEKLNLQAIQHDREARDARRKRDALRYSIAQEIKRLKSD